MSLALDEYGKNDSQWMGKASISGVGSESGSSSSCRGRVLIRLPTADWIYKELKGEFPNLSMGTVYRNLSVLMDQGFVRKIDLGSTFDRFDANIGPHYHFVCERCGAIIGGRVVKTSMLFSSIKQ